MSTDQGAGPASARGSAPANARARSEGAQLAQVLESTAELLRARGDRMTGPRRAVLTALVGRSSHLSPEQVVGAVAEVDPTVHRASVYRALEALSGLGVLQHVHLGHGTTAYHLADPHEHLHAHCTGCDRVIDLPGDLLDDVAAALLRDHGFALAPSHVALSGSCADCSGVTASRAADPGPAD